MLEFRTYFCDEYVYIDGRAYKNNETLTACLNLPEAELLDCLVGLWRLVPSAQLHGRSAQQLRSFLNCMQQSHELFLRAGSLASRLPLFRNGGLQRAMAESCPAALLNRLCPDEGAASEEIDDSFSFSGFYFMRIASALSRLSGAEAADKLDLLNRGLSELFGQYVFLTSDLLYSYRAYSLLLEKYIHQKRSFPGSAELAGCFFRYRNDCPQIDEYELLPSSCTVQSSYKTFTDEDGQNHFSLSCVFNRLRDFLYMDFFRGLERSHLPRRCDNCGRYFLLAGGRYSSYCDNPLPDDPLKTCRSIGAKKRYGSKCKSDPVWLTYNRAYKAHYARYMKGKMTAPEFERWSRYAASLRGQAADGTLGAEQYERLIKK